MIAECQREQDVLELLAEGQWPERAEAELRSHVTTCRVCSDLVAVVSAVTESHTSDDFAQRSRIPSSAVMWWKAQMRARQEAAREAARPITVAQVVAGTTAFV